MLPGRCDLDGVKPDVSEALAPLLLSSPLLRSLDMQQIRCLCSIGRVLHLRAGHTLYRKGDVSASLYLVIEGLVEVSSSQKPSAPGDVVGEFAIVSEAPHQKSARTAMATTLVELPAQTLRTVVSSGLLGARSMDAGLTARLAAACLQRSGLFEGLTTEKLAALARRCLLQPFAPGQLFVGFGDSIYLLISGQVSPFEMNRNLDVAELEDGLALRVSGASGGETICADSGGWLLQLRREAIAEMGVSERWPPQSLAPV